MGRLKFREVNDTNFTSYQCYTDEDGDLRLIIDGSTILYVSCQGLFAWL